MSQKIFEEFLDKQQTKAQLETVNWEEKLNAWKKHLDELYHKIETLLKPYIKQGKIKYSYNPIKIVEDCIGEYEVSEANITIGTNKLKLVPIGTSVIGAKGRVDLIGPNGKIRLVLIDKHAVEPRVTIHVKSENEELPQDDFTEDGSQLEWKIATAPPLVTFFPINEDSFFDALMEISNE